MPIGKQKLQYEVCTLFSHYKLYIVDILILVLYLRAAVCQTLLTSGQPLALHQGALTCVFMFILAF